MARKTYDCRGCGLLAGCLTAAILLPAAVANGGIGLLPVIAIALISTLAVLVGRPLGIILAVPRRPGFIAAFEIVAGFSGLSLVQLGLTFVLRLGSTGAVLLSAPAAVALFFLRGHLPEAEEKSPARRDRGRLGDGAILLVISLFVTLWSREALVALRTAERSGIFNAWWDFFMHGVQVNFLNHYSWFAGRSLYMSGMPSAVYHEGSYVLAALYAGLTGQGALQTTLAFWLPAGLVLTGMGLYGFASALAGRLVGAAAVTALFLVPDASRYGLGNPLFSFPWLMCICPTSGYGIALILIALGVFALGLAPARSGQIFLGAVLAGVSGVFRVQTAAPALLLFAILFFASWRPAQRRWVWGLAAACILFVGASVAICERMLWAPHFLSGEHSIRLFLGWAHGRGIGKFSQHYLDWSGQWTVAAQVAFGVALLLPSAFGLILPGLIATTAWPGRPRRPWQIEWMPFLLLAAYLAVIFVFPASATGDYTEFSHRPFVVVYAVMMAMLTVEAADMLTRAVSGRPWLRPALLGLAIPLGAWWLVLDWKAAATLQQVRGMINIALVPIAPGLPAAAAYIREHAGPYDCVLSSDEDPYAAVVSLTERQAFISKIAAFRQLKGPWADSAAARWALAARLQSLRTYDELLRFAAGQGIRWFVLQPGDMPGWTDAMLARSCFRGGGVRVFELAGPAPARPAAMPLSLPPEGGEASRRPASG